MAIGDWAGRTEVREEMVEVRCVRFDPDKPRGPQLTLEVCDNTGRRRAKCWTPERAAAERLLRVAASDAPWIYVSGRLAMNEGFGEELTLTRIGFLAVGEWPDQSRFTQPLRPDHGQMVEALDHLIASVRNQHLSSLLSVTIGAEGRQRERYLKATAAKVNHHAFPGGLLHHSIEVAEVALHVLRRFPGVNRDLVLTAALLHDVGKIWEMQHDVQCGEYTEAGSLLGHIYLGTEHLDRCCRHLKFPTDLRQHLLHAVLAHHDRLEYGSPIRPLTAEAITLAKSDQISAELTQFFDARQKQIGYPERMVRRGERSFYIGLPDVVEEAGEMPTGDQASTVSGMSLRDLPPPHIPCDGDPEERLVQRLIECGKPGRADTPGPATLPLLGHVAASDGIRAGFEDGGEPEMRPVLIPVGGADFALQVVGDSMTGAGILEGDLLIVRKQETARPGQIVVALVPQVGPVVKRLIEQGGCRYLTSENPDYAPIAVTDGVRVQGVVVRLERELSGCA